MKEFYQAVIAACFVFLSMENVSRLFLGFFDRHETVSFFVWLWAIFGVALLVRAFIVLLPVPLLASTRHEFELDHPDALLHSRSVRCRLFGKWSRGASAAATADPEFLKMNPGFSSWGSNEQASTYAKWRRTLEEET